MSENEVCIAATQNVQQSDETWYKFAGVWLPKCGTSRESPGIVFIDGHSAHVRASFIAQCPRFSIYVIVDPIHTSTLLQVADLGVNRYLKTQYSREYNVPICLSTSHNSRFHGTERIGCVVRTLKALWSRKDIIINCFDKAGLTYGFISTKFKRSSFNAGTGSRDTRLPKITDFYITAVLSFRNMCAKIGAPHTVPETRIGEKLRSIRHYVDIGGGFRQFYFSLDSTTRDE